MDDSATAASRQRLADYLYDLAASWHAHPERHADEDRGTEGLRSLARHIRALDDTDERLYVLAALDADAGQPFRPGPEADRLTHDYRLGLRNEHPDAWFSRFIDALARDRGHGVDST